MAYVAGLRAPRLEALSMHNGPDIVSDTTPGHPASKSPHGRNCPEKPGPSKVGPDLGELEDQDNGAVQVDEADREFVSSAPNEEPEYCVDGPFVVHVVAENGSAKESTSSWSPNSICCCSPCWSYGRRSSRDRSHSTVHSFLHFSQFEQAEKLERFCRSTSHFLLPARH